MAMPAAELPLPPLPPPPLLEPLVLEEVSELALATSPVHVYVPWISPLPPLDVGASFEKVEQELEMSWVDSTSKAPLTSFKLGREMLEWLGKHGSQGNLGSAGEWPTL
jgi:hypothetical protein